MYFYFQFENRSRNEHRFLVRLSNKTFGIKSHQQRINSDRDKEIERDIRIATSSNSASEFLKQSEIE